MIYFGQDKMSEFYYGGTEIKEMYLGNTKVFQNKHPFFLTLETDGHGTLSADVLSGFEGDTVTLSPTYNTYYRFSGYDCTGGTIAGNTFTFGQENATAKANFKVNAFTATGTFNWGGALASNGNTVTRAKTGVLKAFTGSKPSNWPATNANWNVTNASSYGIKVNSTWSKVTNYNSSNCSARILLNGSQKAIINIGGSYNRTSAMNLAYNGTQGPPVVSAMLNQWNSYSQSTTLTCTATFTATGYAP